MKKCHVFLMIAFMALCGCDGSSTGTASFGEIIDPPTLHEREFAQNPGLFAMPDQVVILNLEHPGDMVEQGEDTATAGVDRIPIWYPRKPAYEFSLEVREGDLFSLALYNGAGNRLLLLDKDTPQAELDLEPGKYVLEARHGGGGDDSRTLFIRPGSTTVSYSCPGCHLEKHDFYGAVLAGADLTGAHLEGADLEGADLSGADLTGAGLTGAQLAMAVVSGAAWVDGKTVPVADLQGLYNAINPYARLDGLDMSGIDFRAAGADLGRAHLNGTDLSGANFEYVWFRHAKLVGANLSGAHLSYANLEGTDLTGADLSGAELTGVNFSSATWTDGRKCAEGSFGSCN